MKNGIVECKMIGYQTCPSAGEMKSGMRKRYVRMSATNIQSTNVGRIDYKINVTRSVEVR